MEQYWMPQKMDLINLRKCLDNYKYEHIYIRDMASAGGKVHVNTNLEGKIFDFKLKDKKSKLIFTIDSKEIYTYDLIALRKERDRGFSLAYERIYPDNKIVMLSSGIDPYDPKLPEPKTSTLRSGMNWKLTEITFIGRVNLEFHAWWHKPDVKYWKIK